jgi:ribosomal protein S18 acetylase RimI-like enzyme
MTELPIHLATEADTDWFARQMAATDPWLTYCYTLEVLRKRLDWPGSKLYIAGDRAGGMLAHERGLLGAPYIATLVVAPEHRNQGVGSQLLRFADRTFAGQRQLFICVSAFNHGAQRLYLRHGFEQVGLLPDLLVDGLDELLLRKRLQASDPV